MDHDDEDDGEIVLMMTMMTMVMTECDVYEDVDDNDVIIQMISCDSFRP